jgi:hypothetical protein
MLNSRSKGVAVNSDETKPIALVYRGPAAECDGNRCSDALKTLLENATLWNFEVKYVGLKEKIHVQDGLQLPDAVLYAQPGGGGDEKTLFKNELNDSAQDVRNFVCNGGRYL